MKNKLRFILSLTIMFLSTSACAATFKGSVIDADTKEPIEGAVVVASWNKEMATGAGPALELEDVKETLTDKKGEWMIEGAKGREGGDFTALFTFLTGTYYTKPPEFIVFKPGYCPWPEGSFIDACKKMKWDNDIIELPKLTSREDRRRAVPGLIHPYGPKSNQEIIVEQKEFLRLINKELRYLGLEEYKLYPEKELAK